MTGVSGTRPVAAAQADATDGARFAFGRNWRRYLSVLDAERLRASEASLRAMLGVDSLAGARFLDIGSGSGLFSLAAWRMGARVHSFDYDSESVECARLLKNQACPGDNRWSIEQGSVLDLDYVRSLGEFDVVYSWGVLHHTGAMWTALEHAAIPVAPGGRLFVAIYNDQGAQSKRWRAIKKLYSSSVPGRWLICATAIPWFVGRHFALECLKGRNPFKHYADYKKRRGMSVLHDWFDWLGGYPFEVAKPEEIFRFYRDRGFTLTHLTTKGALAGCNEFVFVREK
jgi:2-polyprenyl-6-hydroxyphenyl methylase/3-demethylubiquinone-9 3-methyltransferase